MELVYNSNMIYTGKYVLCAIVNVAQYLTYCKLVWYKNASKQHRICYWQHTTEVPMYISLSHDIAITVKTFSVTLSVRMYTMWNFTALQQLPIQ